MAIMTKEEIGEAGEPSPQVEYSNISRRTGATKGGGKGMTNIAVIFIAIVAVFGLWSWMSQNKISGTSNGWQAVFLTNGQVYFGQVKSANKSEIILEDIYYLQVTRPLQQTQEGQEQAAATDAQGELSLVKLGNELHGPTDKMYINRDHALFIEDLKDDSNVVQAINNDKGGK